jgi:hypothetical protein
MLTNTERLGRIGADITHSNQIGQETLKTGIATLQELQEQEERIQHSRSTVSENILTHFISKMRLGFSFISVIF